MSWFSTVERTHSNHCETKNRSKDPKDGVFGGFLCVLKIFGHGDDRHSKNGFWGGDNLLHDLALEM